MKKLILICLITSFVLGMAQEKKISFAKELNYQFVGENTSKPVLKMYASNTNEFLTKLNYGEMLMYYYTDTLGTSMVAMDMNNRLNGSVNSWLYGMGSYYDSAEGEKDAITLETQKLNTKETILGIPCSHFLLNLKDGERKDEKLKICIDNQSPLNNFSVLNGILNQYTRKSKFKGSGLNGIILKAGPEKEYDKEHIVLTSMKDTKDFVYFDHKKAMTDKQRKMDSLMLVYKKMDEEYAVADSAAIVVDSAVAAVMDDAYMEISIPDYISEYKKAQDEDGSLAITNLASENLWKGLPKHCKNFEKDLPEFKNKDLKKHLRNYVGQMCDMYLTQARSHSVGIKITLDEIRREVLYLNEVHDQLDESDQKKLKNYLKNLD
ncbi:hypothetical protein CHRYSEOSP005_24080 [Chryseobacterium sp. Alg-005]|uniref:hypothetical protein n=1 Tax=Chryseobacterium sp. Alg-005 TaxID=3159516 RepID=UPI0035559D0A